MLVYSQHFYERYLGARHTLAIVFDYSAGRKCYDIMIDNEFYANTESKCKAYDEIADIIRWFNWTPIKPI